MAKTSCASVRWGLGVGVALGEMGHRELSCAGVAGRARGVDGARVTVIVGELLVARAVGGLHHKEVDVAREGHGAGACTGVHDKCEGAPLARHGDLVEGDDAGRRG